MNGSDDPGGKISWTMAADWLDLVTVRLIREEDLPALEWDGEYTRYRRVYREVFRNFEKGISLPYIAETEADGIIGQVFLTRKEPNPSYMPRSRYFFISSFRIKPMFRDRGLGSRLLEVCFRDARSHRLRDIFLNCAANNNRARHFYEKHGFRVVRLDDGNWSYVNHEGIVVTEHESAYLMKKTLPRFYLKG